MSNHSNPLSCRADHKEGVEEDKSNQVLLDSKFFRIRATRLGAVTAIRDAELKRRVQECSEKDIEVYSALNVILKNSPRLLVKNLQEFSGTTKMALFSSEARSTFQTTSNFDVT